MYDIKEITDQIQQLKAKIDELRDYLEVGQKRSEVEKLNSLMAEPGFWDQHEAAQKHVQAVKRLKGILENWGQVEAQLDDVLVLLELVVEEPDPQLADELLTGVKSLRTRVEQLELSTLLNGEYDQNNAILTIHPGAGGTESQDWAEMLLRMYTRWAEARGYQVEILDLLAGDEAGIKSVTLLISGLNAFGYLQAEKGVHRLVRISPFDASGRRHTSFASVEVMPEIDDQVELEIDPADLRIDTYRASGAGGQHVNKTESAIRITHIPTGIAVQCQTERSQHQNRESAMKILRARLVERKLEEQQEKVAKIKGEQREIAWGNQIRSYVFCPYTMVKDHRTNAETGDVNAVIDGELDQFIEAYLKTKARDQ
ncbi:MAG: peptide chain release factor 2 [Firmicutes bacterium]|nr:peptide chain release factor 2 [Bacillota bacterium]